MNNEIFWAWEFNINHLQAETRISYIIIYEYESYEISDQFHKWGKIAILSSFEKNTVQFFLLVHNPTHIWYRSRIQYKVPKLTPKPVLWWFENFSIQTTSYGREMNILAYHINTYKQKYRRLACVLSHPMFCDTYCPCPTCLPLRRSGIIVADACSGWPAEVNALGGWWSFRIGFALNIST